MMLIGYGFASLMWTIIWIIEAIVKKRNPFNHHNWKELYLYSLELGYCITGLVALVIGLYLETRN